MYFFYLLGSGPESISSGSKYARAALPDIDADRDDVVFQQIDVEYYTGRCRKKSN